MEKIIILLLVNFERKITYAYKFCIIGIKYILIRIKILLHQNERLLHA